MPRRPREEEAGAVHHVTARGCDRQVIFRDDRDRRKYLELLADNVERLGWRILAFCLMDNHVHLLVETPFPNLSAGMQRLHGDYGKWFNARHEHVGHVFQSRFHGVRIKSEAQFWMAAAYIARNPVEAGICRRAEDWLWSSHRAVLGEQAPSWLDVERLLWHFSGVGGDPRRIYETLVRKV